MEDSFRTAYEDLARSPRLMHQRTCFDGGGTSPNNRHRLVPKIAIVRNIKRMPFDAFRSGVRCNTPGNMGYSPESPVQTTTLRARKRSPEASVTSNSRFTIATFIVTSTSSRSGTKRFCIFAPVGSEALHRARLKILETMVSGTIAGTSNRTLARRCWLRMRGDFRCHAMGHIAPEPHYLAENPILDAARLQVCRQRQSIGTGSDNRHVG